MIAPGSDVFERAENVRWLGSRVNGARNSAMKTERLLLEHGFADGGGVLPGSL